MLRLAFIVLALAACGKSAGSSEQPASQAPATPPAKAAKDPQTARKMIADGAVVIDVRTIEEFAAGHLPSAVHIPLADLSARMGEVEQLAKSNKATPIVVYCASGNRSGKAKQQLDTAGYQQVVNGGGLDDLQ
jgi:rhodanese-related sulfurtransferase